MPDKHGRDFEATDVADAWLVEATQQIAADEPIGDVDRLITSISGSLQRIRRPARTLATDELRVNTSDRVVKQLIAVRTRRELGRLTVFVSVDGAGDTVDGVRVGLIARYADDLPALSDERIVSLRQPQDKLMRPGRLRRGDDLRPRSLRPAIRDILGDRPIK